MASLRAVVRWASGLFLAAALVGGLAVVLSQGTALSEGTEVELRVPQGASSRSIATLLEEAQLIDHPRLFDVYVRLKDAAGELS